MSAPEPASTRWTISRTTTVATLVIALITALAVTVVLFVSFERDAREESHSHSVALARTLAAAIAPSLESGEHDIIQRQVDALAGMPGLAVRLVQLTVVDSQGVVVAALDPRRRGERLQGPLPAQDVSVEALGEPSRLVVRAPIDVDPRPGALELTVALRDPWRAAASAAGDVVLGMLLVFAVIFALLTLLLDRLISAPLRRLAQAVDASTHDRTTPPLPHAGPLEVRQLITAFESLARRVNEHSGALEHTVDERTKELRSAYERLEAANGRLLQLAVTDGLTGVANRRAFDERLAAESSRSQRTGRPLSLILFDLDHFKRLNDTLGHVEGDATLVTVGRLLRSGRRATDLVARYGGEEFALILPEVEHAAACTLAERLSAQLAAMGLPGQPTMSAGIATMPDHGGDARALLVAADEALYSAKNSGRNCIRSATELRGGEGVA